MKKLALLAALICSLAAADAARAATVMHDAARQRRPRRRSRRDQHRLRAVRCNGGTVILNDATAPLQAWDDGCAQIGDSMVECAAGAYVAL